MSAPQTLMNVFLQPPCEIGKYFLCFTDVKELFLFYGCGIEQLAQYQKGTPWQSWKLNPSPESRTSALSSGPKGLDSSLLGSTHICNILREDFQRHKGQLGIL